MKSLKQRLQEGVPARYQQTPEFNIFLKLIDSENITTKTRLKQYLNTEITRCKKELAACTSSPTLNRMRSRIAKKIDFLLLCHDKILPHCA
jgi:hypothetical protein